MSVRAMTWAWEQDIPDSTRKLVLMALADHADNGGRCWPGSDLLKDKVQAHERTIRRHIDALAEDGFITKVERVRKGDGKLGVWIYQLHIDPRAATGHQRPVAEAEDHRTPAPGGTTPSSGDGAEEGASQRTPVPGGSAPEPPGVHGLRSSVATGHGRPEPPDTAMPGQEPSGEPPAASSSGAGAREGPGAELDGYRAEMREALQEHLVATSDPLLRRKLEAQAELVITGEDRRAWEVPGGDEVVAEDCRPELFRLALGFHRDHTQKAFRSSVRYVVKIYANGDDPVDPSMSRADRKLVESIRGLRGVDLSEAFR